jgi:rhodanese-related sulfurtransferase
MTPNELRDRCRNAHPVDAKIILECADEIERLRAALAVLRDYGGKVYDNDGGIRLNFNGLWCAEQARRALEETK